MAVASAAAIVVFSAGGAAAQTSCTGPQTASPAAVGSGVVNAGGSLSLTGGGFAANQVLGIGLFQPPVVLASVASDAFGNYAATVALPNETPGGQNEITVFGAGPNGTCHQSLALFTVNPRPIVIVEPPRPIFVGGQLHGSVIDGDDRNDGEDDHGKVVPVKTVKQPLARTGSSSAPLSAAGLVLIALGAAAVVAAGPRRRRA